MSAACAPKTYQGTRRSASVTARSNRSSAKPAVNGTQGLRDPLVDRDVISALFVGRPVRSHSADVLTELVAQREEFRRRLTALAGKPEFVLDLRDACAVAAGELAYKCGVHRLIIADSIAQA